jgi:acyl carrier protein
MTREEDIKSMYHYKSTEEEQTVIPETLELIDNWYIDGFDSIEKLEAMFDVEDLYDMDIDLKIYPRDKI